MQKKRLGDIATYINGYAFKPADRGDKGLPIIRIQDLTGNAYDLGFYDGEYPEQIEINNGDILISWSASLGVYVWNRGKALLNQHIFKVFFDKIDVDKNFFVYAVQHALGEMSMKTHGATMKHIIKKDFENVEIYFPSMEEQRKIANVLSKTESILDNRRMQLQKFDELVKARFVDMFGDPTSDGKYKTVPMEMICTKITDGEHGSVKRTDTGYPFLNAKHISKDGSIDWDTTSFISADNHERIYKRCNPEPGDILITTTGTIGNVAIVPSAVGEFSMDRGITLLKLDHTKVKSEFVSMLLQQPSIQAEMNVNVHASAIGHLYMNKVKKLTAIIPPMEEQNEFVFFARQVEKSKAAVQRSLEETQTLFDSLMQQYFG